MTPHSASKPISLDDTEPDRSLPHGGLWYDAFRYFFRKPSGIVGLIILVVLVIMAVFAPVIATHNPELSMLDVPAEEGASRRTPPCIFALGCPRNGDPLLKLNHDAPVVHALWSTQGTNLLTVSGSEVRLWTAKDGTLLQAYRHDGPVTAVAWTPDERRIVTASGLLATVWDTVSYASLRTFQHTQPITWLAWNFDGSRILVGGETEVAVWDALMWRAVATLQHATPVSSGAFNPNGTNLYTVGGDTVYLWEPFAGRQIGVLHLGAPVNSAVWNSDGNKILVTGGHTARVWATPAGTVEWETITDDPATAAVWRADNRNQVYVAHGQYVTAWDIRDGREILTVDHGAPVARLAANPGGSRFAAWGGGVAHMWHPALGPEPVATFTPEGEVVDLTWEAAGTRVLTAGDHVAQIWEAAGYQHLLGLDGNVRDNYSRIIYGTRVSLVIGFTTVTFAIIIGSILGGIAGYVAGWTDNIIMRLMDVLLAFPALLLAIAIVTVLGPGLTNALLAISIVSIPAYARVARASVLAVKEQDFVMAGRAVGVGTMQILLRHIMPNAITPQIVQGTLGIATAILDAAALSFLGLGAQPPTPEWGAMLGVERNQVFTAPYLVFFPGMAIMVTVLAFNLLGDGLRDALDPRLNRQ